MSYVNKVNTLFREQKHRTPPGLSHPFQKAKLLPFTAFTDWWERFIARKLRSTILFAGTLWQAEGLDEWGGVHGPPHGGGAKS